MATSLGHQAMTHANAARIAARIRQCGLSLVELLVGVAIALFIAAAGSTLLAGNLRESRNLLLEARLMQDLRTATDVISRDLRRAGFWGAASNGVWSADSTGIAANPYGAVAPGSAASDAVSFRYSRDSTENNVVDTNEQFGFRLRNRVIEMQLGVGNWQALTDAGTLDITEFSVTPTVQELDLRAYCTQACPPGSTSCPPRQQVRSLALVVTGRSTTDTSVIRSLRSNVRLRNDALSGACPA
jgi:prepilin peptidase dependent protein B